MCGWEANQLNEFKKLTSLEEEKRSGSVILISSLGYQDFFIQ